MIAGVGTWVLRLAPGGCLQALLVRRSTANYRGEWFTVDGRLEEGESPRETALRELAEETSLEPLLLLHDPATPSRIATVRGDVWLHAFVALVPAHAAIVLNEEHSDWRWASIDEAVAAVPLPSQRASLHRAVRLLQARGISSAAGLPPERRATPGGDSQPF